VVHVTALVALFIWAMGGLGIWHMTIFLPDRFHGGIAGALVAALIGALGGGFLLPRPGMPEANPPGLGTLAAAVAGTLVGLAASAAWEASDRAGPRGVALARRRRRAERQPPQQR
jgi:hypothetical protein